VKLDAEYFEVKLNELNGAIFGVEYSMGILAILKQIAALDGDHPSDVAKRKAMFPYKCRRWFICARCIVEKLGIRPDWVMPGGIE
jgi:hypothetical protein